MRMEKAKLIGKGLTSEVYAWGDGRVLKLFESWVPVAKAEQEYMVTRAVYAAGLPAPAAFELVELDGRKGLVLERVDGISMYESVVARPWRLFGAARQLAELHAQLHAAAAPAELPSQRRQIETRIAAAKRSSADEKQAARRRLAELPDGGALCHGDFHPGNILLTARGAIVIDWSGGTRGHPLADVAQTSLLFEVAALPKDAPLHIHVLFKFSRQLLHASYLKRYLQLRTGTRREIDSWRWALRHWGGGMARVPRVVSFRATRNCSAA